MIILMSPSLKLFCGNKYPVKINDKDKGDEVPHDYKSFHNDKC